ncbi:MAG TPA: glycosyltransferase [Baekduia sp.]|uniref:MGDG synthase family glycosyltransferase n=1 Tax=Baekduia sp. TaxID=2600305 RepID=UPI002D79B99A|nr:glycosyltransferase [Baekduia sp.]HET6505336.1 glycosyltransferase [Baekduia sp.]
MRVLIFSADIGEGHELPARAIRDGLRERAPAVEVEVVDTLAVSGRTVRLAVRTGAETILGRLRRLFDLQYALAARWAPTRRLSSRLATALAGRHLRRLVADRRPDAIVSTYPLATEVLGTLRLRGRLDVPLVSAITDLAALRYWAHPGCDLHLTIHPESEAEIRAIAGGDTSIVPVRGMTAAAFDAPVDRRWARASLGLDPTAPIVVVSGGGWGVGDLRGAALAALSAGADVHVVVLCGRSERAARRMSAELGVHPRVTIMGFTDRMGDVLAAGDVLVHSTAGLTVLEALVRGMRVISYGWGVAHIRVNNEAYRRFGLADVATGPSQLVGAVRRALAAPRHPDEAYGARPSAAAVILELIGSGDDPRGAERRPAGEHERQPR